MGDLGQEIRNQFVTLVDDNGNQITVIDNLDGTYSLKTNSVLSYGNETAVVVDGKLRVVNNPYLYLIAEGKIPNHTIGAANGYKINVPTASYGDIFGTVLNEPHTSVGAKIVSSSADDTNGGIGANMVELHYLDSNWVEKTENVTLNGTTPVTLAATDIYHIEKMHVSKVGSNGAPVGNLDLKSTDLSVIYARIDAGINVTQYALHHVPAGKICYIVGWGGGSYNGGIDVILRSEEKYNGNSVFHIRHEFMLDRSAIAVDLLAPIKVEEKCHIKVSAKAKSASVDCSVNFQYWEESI